MRAYEVEVVDAAELGDAVPPRPGMVRGPYTAETVPVSVEGRLVVVDVGG